MTDESGPGMKILLMDRETVSIFVVQIAKIRIVGVS